RLGQSAMRQQWRLELGVASGFMLIFTQTTVAEVVLLSGVIGILIHSYKARARMHLRRRWRRERQARARGAAFEQQARQHAAEMIEHADEPAELGADYKVEVSLPEKAESERSPDEDGNESVDKQPSDESPGHAETGDEAPANEEPEKPPVS